ncbi:unnamed protein product [Phaeothamnion confervicola]
MLSYGATPNAKFFGAYSQQEYAVTGNQLGKANAPLASFAASRRAAPIFTYYRMYPHACQCPPRLSSRKSRSWRSWFSTPSSMPKSTRSCHASLSPAPLHGPPTEGTVATTRPCGSCRRLWMNAWMHSPNAADASHRHDGRLGNCHIPLRARKGLAAEVNAAKEEDLFSWPPPLAARRNERVPRGLLEHCRHHYHRNSSLRVCGAHGPRKRRHLRGTAAAGSRRPRPPMVPRAGFGADKRRARPHRPDYQPDDGGSTAFRPGAFGRYGGLHGRLSRHLQPKRNNNVRPASNKRCFSPAVFEGTSVIFWSPIARLWFARYICTIQELELCLNFPCLGRRIWPTRFVRFVSSSTTVTSAVGWFGNMTPEQAKCCVRQGLRFHSYFLCRENETDYAYGYQSYGTTLVTLYSAMLGDFDFTPFDTVTQGAVRFPCLSLFRPCRRARR